MNRLIILFFILISYHITAQEAEVRKTIDTFFEGFHAKDTAKLHSVCAEKMILHSISERPPKGSKFSEEPVQDFYNTIASMPYTNFEERILSYTIHTDGALAQVWAPYEFYKDGKLSHKGIDAFTLFKEKDVWKIIYLVDTRRR